MRRSILAGAALASVPIGCQAPQSPEELPVSRVELSAIHQYAEPAGNANGLAGFAESARGALLIPLRDGNGNQAFAADGTAMQASCGAVMVSPSYAVTAAHCVDAVDVPNPSQDAITLEMYAKDAALQTGYLAATNLNTPTNDWHDFQHGQLTATHGYHPQRFDCRVVVRCGDKWGNHNCAPLEPKADVAVVHCEGKPGNIYGHVNVADEDLDDAPVFMPWAHEVYAINDDPGDGLFFDHYTSYANGKKNNLHYFGEDRNQLVPLRSIPWSGATENTKGNHFPAPPNEYRRWTDLSGCHGTSGSPVMQPNPGTGLWELLGPAINPNGSAWTDRLCADPTLQFAGQASLAYGALRLTKHAIADVDDCDELTQGKGLLFATWCWLKKMEWIEFQPIPESWPCLSCPPFLQLRVFGEPLARIGEEPVELPLAIAEGTRTRVAMAATALDGEAFGMQWLDDAGEVVFEAELPPEGYVVFGTTLDSPVGGSLHVQGLGGPVGLTQVQVAASEASNRFTDAIERIGVGSQSLDDVRAPPTPMTFGVGEGGFAAQITAGQRMLMTRSALVPNRRWMVAFGAAGEGELSCGFVLEGGDEVVSACVIEGGMVHTEFDIIEGTPVAFFVDALDTDGVVTIDDVSLVDAE